MLPTEGIDVVGLDDGSSSTERGLGGAGPLLLCARLWVLLASMGVLLTERRGRTLAVLMSLSWLCLLVCARCRVDRSASL